MASTSRLRRWFAQRLVLRSIVALVAVTLVVATVPRLAIHSHAAAASGPHAHAVDHDAHDAHHDAHDAHHDEADDPLPDSDALAQAHVHPMAAVTVALPAADPVRVAHLPHEAWPGLRDTGPPPRTSANPPYRPPIA